VTKRGYESDRLPGSLRHIINHPLATWSAAIEPHHVGTDGGLVDKDQMGGVKQALLSDPAPPCPSHVRPLPFGCPQIFFEGDVMTLKEPPQPLRLVRIRSLRNPARSSSKVESGCSLTSPSINVVCSSNRDVLPPRGFGAVLPVSRQCCHHLTAVLTAIPKSSAASCRDVPHATISITRLRKSAA
jgi:hypothetical protein